MLALGALGILACGGGGSGGGGPTEPLPSLTFTPAGGGGPESLSLRRASTSTANRLVLELAAEQVTDLYGVAFDLQYPSAVLAFDGASEEGFLSEDRTVATAFEILEAPSGNLVVGLTRLGGVGSVGGSGVLLRIELRAVASGSGSFRFEGPQAFSPQGVPLDGVTWNAGTVVVVR
jgi:hypothetical protein